MNFSIVVPKKKINKGKKPGGGSDFWKSFWEKKITDDTREHYARVFSKRVRQIDTTVKKIKSEAKTAGKLLYVEVELDELANSKSNSPADVWNETGLEIVGSKNDKTFIVSGKIEDFDRLVSISNSGSFDAALTGEDLPRKKDKNLLRELYAMSAVTDRNTIIEGRVSNYIYSLIHGNILNQTIDCIIEIYPNIGKDKYDTLFDSLNDQLVFRGKLKKRNINLFFSNISFLATLTANEIIGILSDADFNFIGKIREQPILSSQRCIPEINLGALNLLAPLTAERVGLIDSGIYNPILQQLRAHHHNYLSRHQVEDKNHGTIVASRILFGDNFFMQLTGGGSIAPTCNILDIQVLYLDGSDSKCVSLDELKGAISEVVNRYEDISIYNLSINENEPIDKDDVSELTEFLDNIAREYDVIFVCSVGNHQVYASENYNTIFKQEKSLIASPSDALNVISVGSISGKADASCVNVEQGFPAPFTRTSSVAKDIKKPELVANGGNVKKDPSFGYGNAHMISSNQVFGVESINKDGLNKDIGTSLSAPLITR
ncbi:MAG: S8 family peptidase [bacterium]|nr:S8 family peptidase [bacterium]